MRKADYHGHPLEKNVSGCCVFTGEDRAEEDRVRKQRDEQRAYLMKQMEEKKQKKDMEKKQDFLYDQQRMAITRAVD